MTSVRSSAGRIDCVPVLDRSAVSFPSGEDRCAAWHYPGTNGACVVMAPGAGVTKEPGTDRFAIRFQDAGYTVLAIDFRNFGESGGTPRQVIRPMAQVRDFVAAVEFARTLPDVDPERIAAWGFSLAGGHVINVANRSRIAAAIAQTPLVDGIATMPNALRHETAGVILRFPFIAAADAIRGLLGRAPVLVPLAGPRGTVAMLTTPDAQDASRALDPEDRHSWRPVVAARSVIRLGAYRPGCRAAKVACPMLLVVADNDQSALAAPATKVAARVPRAELVRVPGGHYAPFLEEHEAVVEAEVGFLNRHLLGAERD